MIAPYSNAIETLIPRFFSWGVRISEDKDYLMTLLGKDFVVEISAERYYHPRLGVTFIDSQGRRFEEFLLEQVLDPVGRANRFSQLVELIKEHDIRLKEHDAPGSEACVFRYAVITVESALGFIAKFRPQLVPIQLAVEVEYDRKSLQMMCKLIQGETLFG